jgi:hypothetical protein
MDMHGRGVNPPFVLYKRNCVDTTNGYPYTLLCLDLRWKIEGLRLNAVPYEGSWYLTLKLGQN